jgi:hypothetical protein
MIITHCIHGHLYDDANTYFSTRRNGSKKKHCRACARQRAAVYYERERERRSSERQQRIEEWKRPISEIDLSWAAGHFEGEGTISISSGRRKGYARPLASLCSTDQQVIALFDLWWPSSMAGIAPRVPTENSRPVYRWGINSAVKVRAFIDQLSPFLRTDRCKQKFDLVGEFVDRILAPHTGKEKPRFPEYIDRIRQMNRRGSLPFLGQILLPTGETVHQRIESQKLLPPPEAKP